MEQDEITYVFLFIGQFGNQIGAKFLYSLTSKDGDCFLEKNSFISVDTEQKAARNCDLRSFPNVVEMCIVDKRGRGANWAMGYSCQGGNGSAIPAKDAVIRKVKRKVERCDGHLPEIVMIHSLVGGTGGGFSCSILESIREEFPIIHITSVTTSPFVSGETPLQHYNALLTLTWLQRYADCILMFHNDELMQQLTKMLKKPSGGQKLPKITLEDMNDYICYNIADIFHPFLLMPQQMLDKHQSNIKSKSHKLSESVGDNRNQPRRIRERTKLRKEGYDFTAAKDADYVSKLGKMTLSHSLEEKEHKVSYSDDVTSGKGFAVTDSGKNHKEKDSFGKLGALNSTGNKVFQDLVMNQNMKFLSCKQKHSMQFTTDYKSVLKSLIMEERRLGHDGSKYKLSALLISARGEYAKTISCDEGAVIQFLKSKSAFGDVLYGNVNILTSCFPVPGYHAPLSLGLYVNTNQIADFIDHVLYKSTVLYKHSAYLHWFQKYGITDDYFDDAIESLSAVVEDYNNF